MRSMNKIFFAGYAASDPVGKIMDTGITIAYVIIVTCDTYFNKRTNSQEEKKNHHRITCFNKLAEICMRNIKAGDRLYIDGRVESRSMIDEKTNALIYSAELVANEILLLRDIRNKDNEDYESADNNDYKNDYKSEDQYTPLTMHKSDEKPRPRIRYLNRRQKTDINLNN